MLEKDYWLKGVSFLQFADPTVDSILSMDRYDGQQDRDYGR